MTALQGRTSSTARLHSCHTTVMEGRFRCLAPLCPFPSPPARSSEAAMTDIAVPLHAADHVVAAKPKLDTPTNPIAGILFFGFLAAGVLYTAYSLYVDVDESGMKSTTYLPYLLLFVALLIALGFEFVNGFHDTANAVATVIYTHSLPAPV